MTKTLKNTFRMTALAAALLAVYGPALAQDKVDPDVARLISPSSEDYISLGGGLWSKERPFQGQYDGMSEGGGYLLLDGLVRRRNNDTGTWFNLDMRNLGLDTREVRLGIQRQGDIGGYIDYNQIPRKYPWTIYTNLLGIGQTNMTIQPNTPAASEVHLGTKRDRTSLGFFKYLNSLVPGLKFNVDYRHEDKKGQINYGLGSQPLFLVDPIDSTIQLLDANFSYSRDKLQLRGGYYATWYNNSDTLLFGTRTATGMPGSTQNPNPTPLSQPLDNESWQIYLDGGYSFTPTTRLMWKAKYGQATMDEQFPSWNLAAPNNPAPTVPQQINGKINTTLLQASLSTRAIPKLSINANIRYHDMHDKTPLVPTATSGSTPSGFVYNTPQSITTTSGKVEAGYSLPAGFKLIGTVTGSSQDRSVPVAPPLYVPYRDTHLDEWTYGVHLRRNLSETVNGSIGYVYSTRDGSGYTFVDDPTAFAENQISPWHIADRNRQKIRGVLDWTPMDSLSLQGVVEAARDQYPHEAGRPYGMINGKGNLYSIDATYQISEGWRFIAYYAYDTTKADRYHARWDRITDVFEGTYAASLKDRNDTLGANLEGKIGGKWKVGANVLWTRARSTYDESWNPSGLGGLQTRYPTSGGETLEPLPEVKTELTRFGAYADYAVQKNASLRLDVIYEHWTTNDWTYSFANGMPFTFGTTGATADGTYFVQDSPQNSTFVGLRYKYMLD